MDKKVIDYKKELNEKGVLAFVPSGNSMWPTLKSKKQSVVIKAKTQKLQPFDVALYERQPNVYVLHRVIQDTEEGYITCGDSQFTLELVDEDKVFGVMEGFYRGKKYIEVTDKKYIAKTKRWYKNKNWRRFRIKTFLLSQRIKNKIKRVFSKIFSKKKANKDV